MKNKIEILGMDRKPILLNARETLIANTLERQINNVGYDVDITTLTTIQKSIIEQKFFTVPFADYMPVKVGEGAWSQELLTWQSISLGGSFGKGIMDTGSDNTNMASADTQMAPVRVPIANWAKKIGWSLFDLQIASKSGNWDIVTAKERARKQNWDLGIQEVSFLGLTGNTANFPGLLNQSDVTVNTTTITKFIKDMTSAEFTAFTTKIIGDYRANSAYTSMPTHFIIPEVDFNGLAAPYDVAFPIKTKIQVLEEMFAMLTMNKNFKILPVAYANKAIQGTKNTYTLLNYNEDSVKLDIPVNYTSTLANSIDNFNFQNVGYGQFAGVKAYRPKEMLYFTHAV